MNTILNLYIRKEIWKFRKPPGKFRNLEILSPWKNFHYYSKNLEFRKPPGFEIRWKFRFRQFELLTTPCKFSNNNEILD